MLVMLKDYVVTDIAIKWGHSSELLKMLLLADRTQDPHALFILQFGCLASLYIWFASRTRYVAIGRMCESVMGWDAMRDVTCVFVL